MPSTCFGLAPSSRHRRTSTMSLRLIAAWNSRLSCENIVAGASVQREPTLYVDLEHDSGAS